MNVWRDTIPQHHLQKELQEGGLRNGATLENAWRERVRQWRPTETRQITLPAWPSYVASGARPGILETVEPESNVQFGNRPCRREFSYVRPREVFVPPQCGPSIAAHVKQQRDGQLQCACIIVSPVKMSAAVLDGLRRRN